MNIEEAKRIYMHLDPAKQFISGIDTDFFFNFAYVVLSELDKKDKIIEELAGMVFDSRKLTYVDEEQYKERKKEIIEYAEGQATGRAM